MTATDRERSQSRLRHSLLALAVAWTATIVGLATWDYLQARDGVLAQARSAAAESLRKDLTYRRWATMHGGVYVPVTPKSPPNPYLSDVPERDITTPSGRALTLVNPAYMTRQVHELGRESFGSRGHITSLDPIRKENAPDEWEARALQSFERGEKETWSIAESDGDPSFRFMQPMVTETACLKCHEAQGYKVGEIRGGISVSVPWAPYEETLRTQLLVNLLAFGGIWSLGIVGLGVARSRLDLFLTETRKAEAQLHESEKSLREVQEVARVGSYRLDIPAGKWRGSPILNRIFGIGEKMSRDISEWLDIVHPDDREPMSAYLREIIASRRRFDREYRIVRANDGMQRWVWGLGEVEYDTSGSALRMLGSIQDVTERKQAEEALQRRAEELRASNDELRRFHNVTVGREMRVIKLKQEVNELCRRQGEPPRYESAPDVPDDSAG